MVSAPVNEDFGFVILCIVLIISLSLAAFNKEYREGAQYFAIFSAIGIILIGFKIWIAPKLASLFDFSWQGYLVIFACFLLLIFGLDYYSKNKAKNNP